MNKDLDYYMRLNYKIEIIKDEEEKSYVIRCPELTGCITCAESIELGLEMIDDAKKCWFTACMEDGIAIPEPSILKDYNSRLKLRTANS